jgi:REP element-mobilizing transposase RayT
MITPDLEPMLYQYMREAAEEAGGQIIELGGTADHVHILAAIRPDVALSSFMQRVKGSSSWRLGAEHEEHEDFQWQTGFAAYTVTPFNLSPLREYVRDQKQRHEDGELWPKFEAWREGSRAA